MWFAYFRLCEPLEAFFAHRCALPDFELINGVTDGCWKMRALLRYTMLYWLLASPALAQNGGVLGLLRIGEDIEPAALRPMQRDGVQYAGRYAGTSGTFRYYGGDGIGALLAPTYDYRFEAIGTVQHLQFTRGEMHR